jgi:hypothetical protein
MAVNFNLLRQAGPANFYEGFTQGQEEQRTNALTQQKMAQEQDMNALRRQQAELQMQQTRGAISEQERAVRAQAVTQKTGMFRDRLLRAPTPEAAREVVKMQYADPDVGGLLSQFGSLEQALAEVPADPAGFQQYIQREAMGMSEWMKSQLPKTVGNNVFLPSENRFLTPPAQPKEITPPAMVAEYKFAQTPEGGGFRGSYQEFVIAREAAKRPPPAPRPDQAPVLTRIQDPTNPAQMIEINTRTYRGGGIGSPGVYGTTGKAPAITAAEQKKEEGATQARDILDTLRASYDELDRLRAVPSDQRGALSNAIAYVASTGVGQVAGRVAGTKEQTQRDVIASARNQMLNAIKNATGMSAQQLNSNVEFRSWLEALTDPTRSIEANRSILDNMEKFIASGGKYSAKKGGGDNAPAASNVAQERADANAAIAAGAPAAAVRARFKEKTGQEL